jgi:hypothetical protein
MHPVFWHNMPSIRLTPLLSTLRASTPQPSTRIPRLYNTMSTSLPMPTLPRTNEGKRICQVIKVKPEALDEYKKVCLPPLYCIPCIA